MTVLVADEKSGTEPDAVVKETDPRQPPGAAPEGVVLPGTVWESPDIITEADPSELDSLSCARQGKRLFWIEAETGWSDGQWASVDNIYLFNVQYRGRAEPTEFQVHPQYGSSAAALAQVTAYASLLGRLPRALLANARKVQISVGTTLRAASGNPVKGVFHIFTRKAKYEARRGFLEEVLLHEGGHVSLDRNHADTPGWVAAQEADGRHISPYARDNPDREDMAETLWAWFVSRCVPDRLHPEYKRRIDAGIPHRLTYLDRLGLNMRPWPRSRKSESP